MFTEYYILSIIVLCSIYCINISIIALALPLEKSFTDLT